VHDPESGRLLGIVDLTGRMKTAHPHSLAVESGLRFRVRERDAQLRARYLTRITSGREPRALVSPTGRVIADHPEDSCELSGSKFLPAAGSCSSPPACPPLQNRSSARRRSSFTRSTQQVASPGWPERAWARIELSQLAKEQAALRRVTTLVASQAAADEIFASVAEEVARLLLTDRAPSADTSPTTP
jgi:hypothetical protein